MNTLTTPVQVGHTGGLRAWLRQMASAARGWPATYRMALERRRGRTVLLTLLIVLLVAYPVLYQTVLAPVVRILPLPSATVMVFMLIFAIMAIGLNIVIGFAGLLDLGYVAFYALGAYTTAFLTSPHWGGVSVVLFASVPEGSPGIHLPFMLVVILAAGVAATFGVLLGAPTLRLRGDYLAIVTLGFGEIVPIFFKNLVNVTFSFGPIQLVNANLTGGPLGINPIDPPSFFGFKFGVISGFNAVYLGLILIIVAIVIARNLERSRMGRAWMAVREDEIAAEMMGVNTVRTKLLAFGLGAAFAGIAGAYQASYQGATTSDFFQFSTSILVVVMIILGGIGNIWGVIAGAVVVQYVDKTLLPWAGQRLTDIGNVTGNPALGDINPSTFSFLLFGIALVAMMRFRPEGFVPSRQRAAEMHTAPPGQALGSIGLIEKEGLVPQLDPTEPGGEADPGSAEMSVEGPAGETKAEHRVDVTDEEMPR
ncbi:MAG: branched-chain amino acid ABC transporter permease [Chloroflexota bacterium]